MQDWDEGHAAKADLSLQEGIGHSVIVAVMVGAQR